jgi:RNA polymerase sigma factor (sigma-70 family)
MNELSKTEWVRAALERYEQPLLRYAARITGDMEVARDVVQDTFLKLCTAERPRVDDHLAAWLYTVCRNRALDVRKKEGRMDALTDVQAAAQPSREPAPSVAAERHEAHELVLDALGTLPEKQQEAFRLKFQDELTYREISQVMGVSLGKVSSLIGASLDTIRQRVRVHATPTREVQSHEA